MRHHNDVVVGALEGVNILSIYERLPAPAPCVVGSSQVPDPAQLGDVHERTMPQVGGASTVLSVSQITAFVYPIAKHLRRRLPPSVELGDLVSAGTLGLLEAQTRYRPTSEVEFASFAYRRIHGAMIDMLRGQDWCSRDLRDRERGESVAISRLTARLGREPSQEEVAELLDLSLEAYQDFRRRLSQVPVSESKSPSRDNGPNKTLPLDLIASANEQDALARCILLQEVSKLRERLDVLSVRLREVITLIYYEDLSMREVGQKLGIRKTRVCQLHMQALALLRGD